MITPILEKWLLTGQAKNKIHWVGYGMFSQIQIPSDSFIVIHKIHWNGWLNQKLDKIVNMNWKQFFNDTEYQLKIQGDKENPIYYIYRNEVNFQYFGDPALNPLKMLNELINDAQYDDYILMTPKKPLIIDCFITAYDYLNFTISRNSLHPTAQNFLPVNNYANEVPPPFGIAGPFVLLDCTLTGSNGTQTTINPPGPKASSPPITIQPNNTDNYHQELDPENLGAGDYGSFLTPPIGGIKLKYSDYVTNPLIGFEYCIIQKNKAGDLSPL